MRDLKIVDNHLTFQPDSQGNPRPSLLIDDSIKTTVQKILQIVEYISEYLIEIKELETEIRILDNDSREDAHRSILTEANRTNTKEEFVDFYTYSYKHEAIIAQIQSELRTRVRNFARSMLKEIKHELKALLKPHEPDVIPLESLIFPLMNFIDVDSEDDMEQFQDIKLVLKHLLTLRSSTTGEMSVKEAIGKDEADV